MTAIVNGICHSERSISNVRNPTKSLLACFALPGGHVYITRGILAYLNSEAELATGICMPLASILAPEINGATGKSLNNGNYPQGKPVPSQYAKIAG